MVPIAFPEEASSRKPHIRGQSVLPVPPTRASAGRRLGAKGKTDAEVVEFQKTYGGFWRFDPNKPNQTQADGTRFSTGHRHSLALQWNPVSKNFFMAMMGCHYGFQTHGGAEGVGRSTMQAVVASCVSILIGVGLIAGILPARRAAAVDPVESLRYE